MNKDAFLIPKDFHSRPDFRCLESEAGFEGACAAVLLLFRELSYLVESQRFAFITPDQLERSLVKQFKRQEGTQFQTDPVESLKRSRFLIACENGFECRQFAVINGHLSEDFVSKQKKGLFMSNLGWQKKKCEEEIKKQASAFDIDIFRRPDGQLMDESEKRGVIMIIKLVDNQYGRSVRTPKEFNIGLVNDAYSVFMKHTESHIRGVCFWIFRKRDKLDSGLPLRTEEALREFDTLVQKYGRIGVRQRQTRPPKQNSSWRISHATPESFAAA